MGKHTDKGWLYREYVEKERRPSEIAEECGVHPDTIYYHINKHGFPKVDHSAYMGQDHDEPYHDKEWLEREYWENGRDTVDIGKECGVRAETIRRWLEKHDLGTRDRSEAVRKQWENDPERRRKQSEWMAEHRDEFAPYPSSIHPSIFTRNTGHVVATGGGDEGSIGIHRLLAVAEYGLDAVAGMDVHHKNGIPWDNRPENIELLTRSEHMRTHRLQEA